MSEEPKTKGGESIDYIKRVFSGVPACFMDGAIFVAIAICGAMTGALGSDDAAKWIDPKTLWVSRNIFFAGMQGLLALKAFRSTAYGDARRKINSEAGHTESFTKP